MCNVDISRTIPTTLFLKTKYLKYHKISFKFRAITNLSCVPLNPWLIPRINIQKSNLYRNGFIVKKLIYWSEHTHNRPGWRSKSQDLLCPLCKSEPHTAHLLNQYKHSAKGHRLVDGSRGGGESAG